MLTEAAFNSGLRRFDADARAVAAGLVCYYFINDCAPPSFVVDVSAHYERKRAALACYDRSSARRRRRGATRG